MRRFYIFILSFFIMACAPQAGPRNFNYRKNGDHYRKATIKFHDAKGKKHTAQIDTWKNDSLYHSKVYYEYWPNGEWKFVSKKGFYTYRYGNYLLLNNNINVPDHIIYKYFDKDFEEVIEVYKNGKRVPFTLGYTDGHTTMKFMVKKPGVYTWKNGEEIFVREFTKEEWESHRAMNEYMNRNNKIQHKAE